MQGFASRGESCQVKEWFQYDIFMPHGAEEQVRKPKGSFCKLCGRIRESWPGHTVERIKELLKSDIEFEVKWEVAKRRINEGLDIAWRSVSVTAPQSFGMRVEWIYGWIEDSVFLKLTYKSLAQLKIKTVTLTDPEGHQRVGALFRLEDIPDKYPYVKVTLYSDTATCSTQTMLGEAQSLHPQHGSNVLNYQVEQNVKQRGPALSSSGHAPYRWKEVEDAIAKIEAPREQQERDAEDALGRADAATADNSSARAAQYAAAWSAYLGGGGNSLLSTSGAPSGSTHPGASKTSGPDGDVVAATPKGKAPKAKCRAGKRAPLAVLDQPDDDEQPASKRRSGIRKKGSSDGVSLIAADAEGDDPEIKDYKALVHAILAKSYSPGREMRGVRA